MSSAARRALVDRAAPALPVVAQCRLLKIARYAVLIAGSGQRG